MPSGDALLRDLDARMDLPSKARSEVLREVRDDLQDLVEVLVDQGMSREGAERRAVELLYPGDEAVLGLTAVHRSPYGELAARLGHDMAQGTERAAVLAMAGLAVAAPVAALTPSGRMPGWSAFPLLILAGAMVALLTREGLRWWMRREEDVRALVQAAVVQAATVVLALVWGALATVTAMYHAAAAWEVVTPSPPAVAASVSRVMTLLSLTLGVAILGVFGFLALIQALWHARSLEREIADVLQSFDFN